MAVLAIAPLVIVARLLERWGRVRFLTMVESLLQGVVLVGIAREIFGRFVNAEVHFFYLLFLPLSWIVIHHGQAGSAIALAAVFMTPIASDWLFSHHDKAVLELHKLAWAFSHAVTSLCVRWLSSAPWSGELALA